MTFIIRQITRRPSGDDIIRDREVPGDEVTVGRATHNEIFLSDLRVGLDHLTIFLSGTRLSVESEKGHPFTIDGREQSKLTLSQGNTKSIMVGPFQLSFEAAERGVWRISVERVEPEAALEEDQVDEIFTLRGTLLGKRLPSWAGYLGAIFLFLAVPVAWFYGIIPNAADEVVDLDRSWLSGPLSSDHANLAGECQACHQAAFDHVNDSACIECHDELGDHAEPVLLTQAVPEPSGVDGLVTQASMFFGKERGQCADCHREHNDDEGLILEASVLCADCHTGLHDRIETDLEDASSFRTSHPNFQAVLIDTPGATLGDEPTFRRVPLGSADVMDNTGLKFPHDLHLETSGGVARQAQTLSAEYGFGDALVCEDCHSLDKDGLLFEQIEMEANCQMCHALDLPDEQYTRELPHGKPTEVIALIRDYYRNRTISDLVMPDGSLRRRPGDDRRVRRQPRPETARVDAMAIAEEQVAQIFAEKGACGTCHVVKQPPAGTVDFDIQPVRLIDKFMIHAEFDHDAHDIGDLTCDSCHEAKFSSLSTDVLLPQIETQAGLPGGGDVEGCRECHGDEKSRAPLTASACLDCHGYHDGTHAPIMRPREVVDASGSGGELSFNPSRWGRIPEGATIR
ncbi:cytochrome c3 family protein [Parvularcula marina]|uniref:cytochrome c3 family protein n=1 Tax=Parvularcula marina TaxID=2292771 RepID=UPI003518239E